MHDQFNRPTELSYCLKWWEKRKILVNHEWMKCKVKIIFTKSCQKRLQEQGIMVTAVIFQAICSSSTKGA